MLSNISFTINTVLPVFLTILIGFAARRRKIISESGAMQINAIVFKILLPLLLFSKIAFADIYKTFDLKYIAFVCIGTVITFVVTWFLAEIFIKDKGSIGSFVQGSFRHNVVLLSFPLIFSVLGNDSAVKAAIVTPFLLPILNVFSVLILTLRNRNPVALDKHAVKKVIIGICKNPLILSILIALPFSILKIKLPVFIHSTVSYVANCASPIALLSIGAAINISKMKSSLKLAFVASSIKILISPAIFIVIAYLLKFSGNDIVSIGLMLAAPAAVSSYIMASNMNADGDLSANIVVVSTFFSAFTLTLFVYVSKCLGFI